jgi:hypothetical protein
MAFSTLLLSIESFPLSYISHMILSIQTTSIWCLLETHSSVLPNLQVQSTFRCATPTFVSCIFFVILFCFSVVSILVLFWLEACCMSFIPVISLRKKCRKSTSMATFLFIKSFLRCNVIAIMVLVIENNLFNIFFG